MPSPIQLLIQYSQRVLAPDLIMLHPYRPGKWKSYTGFIGKADRHQCSKYQRSSVQSRRGDILPGRSSNTIAALHCNSIHLDEIVYYA